MGGQIPSSVTGRTQLSLIANPIPGSIAIEVAPTLDRREDLYPAGPALFDVEEDAGAKPLADLAINELSTLISQLDEIDSDSSEFIEHLTNLGPRAATSVKGICNAVDKGNIDVDLVWAEPQSRARTATLTHQNARRAVNVITTANIESEEIIVEGKLLTVTESAKDRLRIQKDDGKEIVVSIGDIEPAATYNLHTGQRVRILVEQRMSNLPGGKRDIKLFARSIEALPAIGTDN